MKKVLMLCSILLSACTCAETEEVIVTPKVEEQKPVVNYTKPSYNTYRSYNNECNTCSTSYTISKPVEVIYKDVTYTTVYEPKTYEEVSYSRKPYNSCTNSDLCE